MMPTSPNRTKVFVSYSHKDRKYLERLQVHLTDLTRKGMIDLWSDTKVTPGANWREEVSSAIEDAAVAVLLVSADFLASQFITENELPPILKSAKTRGTFILPIILSPCGFDFSPLSQFQAVNDPSKPLTKMNSHQKEELWNRVAKTIREAIASKFTTDGFSPVAASNAYTEHERLSHVSYGPLPSNATVKTSNQFIMLEARSGGVSSYMLDIAKEVLADIQEISQLLHLGDGWVVGELEFLMFRGAWFDDKHGSAVLFIDLLHDSSVQPTLTEDDVRTSFHDGFTWYGDQGISIVPRIIKISTHSDGFFATSNEYYIGFPWLQRAFSMENYFH